MRASSGVVHVMVCAVSAIATEIPGGTKRRPIWQRNARRPHARGQLRSALTAVVLSGDRADPPLAYPSSRGRPQSARSSPGLSSAVVGLRDANQGGEVEVLMRELNEFHAAVATFEHVLQRAGLPGPDR